MKQYPSSKCEQCGIIFKVINGKGKFCGLECYHKSLKTLDKYKSKVCLYCHKPFISIAKSKVQIGLNKYCSKHCRRTHQGELQRTGIYKTCVWCNKSFYVKNCNRSYRFCNKQCASSYKTGKPNPKASITIANLVASGKFNPKRNYYKQGYYISKVTGNREWFGSSYEERRMIQLDSLGMRWTKKHGIKIKYIDSKQNLRHYIPDFLIGDDIIEEVKPSNLVHSNMDNNNLKYDAAIEYCKLNGYHYQVITEKDL